MDIVCKEWGNTRMKLVRIDELVPGDIVSKDIITKAGNEVAKAGSVLSDPLIKRLHFYGFETIEIEDTILKDNVPAFDVSNPPEVSDLLSNISELLEEEAAAEKPVEEKPVEEKPAAAPQKASEPPKAKPEAAPKKNIPNEAISYANRLKQAPEYQSFQIAYSKAIVTLEKTFISIIEHEGQDYSRDILFKSIEPLFSGKTSLDILTYIQNMQGNDDSVYAHSVNVALVSRAIGKWLKLSHDDLDDLTLAGLLHDIGKCNVPPEILNKAGRLTEEEFELIKKHPLDGRKLLKQCADMDSRYLNAALQHHERSDGSGYPRGLDDDEIDDFAAIVAIADVYDAMTATRAYRSAMSPFEVIRTFEKDGLSKYRTGYILTFLQKIAEAYQNSLVLLSDGRRGRVIYTHKHHLSMPIVELAGRSIVDLVQNRDIQRVSRL